MTRQQRKARFNQLQRQQAKLEKVWQPRIAKARERAINPITDYLLSNSIAATIPLAASLYNADPIKKVFQQMWLSVGVKSANDEYGFILRSNPDFIQRKAFGFNDEWQKTIQVYLDIIAGRKITNMTRTDQEMIIRQLAEALEKGYDTINAAEMIRQSEVNTYRSRLIARTEILGASSMGSEIAAKKTGLTMKKTWLSAQRFSTRRVPPDQFDHWVMHEISVNIDDLFAVPKRGGVEMIQYPGDPFRGSAGNVCNCLCKVIYEPQRDRNGRLITI